MTKMTTNQDIADAFARGERTGEVANMFIEGDTIYSYGTHFPIARWHRGVALFNPDGYSNTTAKHKYHVCRALESNGVTIITVAECDPEKLEAQIKINQNEIFECVQKYRRARTPHSKYAHKERMNLLKQDNTEIKRLLDGAQE